MATTPQPLPFNPPAPISQQNLLLLAAANATNGTAPHIITGVAASSPDVATAVTNSQALAQNTNILNKADTLKTSSAKVQQAAWDTMTASEQSQLNSVGYAPPKPSRSIFGDITHAASDVLNVTPVKDTLNALGSPLRAVQHFARSVGANLDYLNVNQLPNHIFSTSDWANAWNETSNGQSYIDAHVRQVALKQYGQSTYTLAYQLATTGLTPQELAASAPQAQQSAVYAALTAKPVQDAYAYLNAGHLSLGRALLGAGFISRNPTAGRIMSGSIDALTDVFSDPTIIGGKAASAYKAARYVVQSGEDVERLYQTSTAVKAMFAEIASRVASGSTLAVQDALPQLKAIAAELVQGEVDTEAKVLQYFKNAADGKNTIEGMPTGSTGQLLSTIPRLTKVGRLTLAAKTAFTHVIDFNADRPFANLPAADRAIWDDNDLYLSDDLTPSLTHDNVQSALTPVSPLDRLTVGLARSARRILTLEPTSFVMNFNDPASANTLRDIGLRFLPREVVDKYVTEYVKDPSYGNRVRVFHSMNVLAAHAAGISDPDAIDAVLARSKAIAGRRYATDNLDAMTVDGAKAHMGVIKADMAEQAVIPDFKNMWLQGRRAGIMKSLGMAINKPWMDNFMAVWRPLTLLRYSFGMRFGGEEMAGFVLRHGITDYLRSQAASSLYRNTVHQAGDLADSTFDSLTNSEAGGLWHTFTNHLPEPVKSAIATPGDMISSHLADVTAKAKLGLASALTPARYKTSVDQLINHGVVSVPDHINAIHNPYDATSPNNTNGTDFLKTTDSEGRKVNAEIVAGKDYTEHPYSDPFFTNIWYYQLYRIAQDDWGREALLTSQWANPAQRLNHIAGKLLSDPMWHHALRSTQNRAGELVAAGHITLYDAAMDHASVLAHHVDHLITSPVTKKIIGMGDNNLANYLLDNGRPPSIDALKTIDLEHWPKSVQGPELRTITTLSGKTGQRFRDITNWSFQHIVGPQVNWISRTPMFIHNYTVGRDLSVGLEDSLRAGGMEDEQVESIAHERAMTYAMDNTTKFIHNPELRSEMSVLTRNVSPFWFAQEQFYKRWARTFSYSPENFRKAQLFVQGLRHSGFLETDPSSGTQYFVYPGSALTQEVIGDFLSKFGMGSTLPVAAGLTGSLTGFSPAFSNGTFRPGVGPMISAPLTLLKSVDPHFHAALRNELTGAVLGNITNSEGFLQSVLPATVVHAAQFLDPEIATAQYASAQLQAIQAVEAEGKGLAFPAITQVAPNIANPHPGDYYQATPGSPDAYVYQPDGTWKLNSANSLHTYLTNIRNYARTLFATRLIFGFSVPSSPQISFNPDHLNTDYRALTNTLPLDVAASTFLTQHPDATAETIAQSAAASGTSTIPETAAAMSFIDNHPSLASTHALAAPYFIPAAASTAKYSYAAYVEQLANGLRVKDTPQQFLNEVIYQQAANIFYPVQNQMYNLIAANPSQSAQIKAQFDQWSQQFMLVNPVFANLYATTDSSAGAKTTREQVMADVGSALQDGTAPPSLQTTAVTVVHNTYVQWQQWRGDYTSINAPTVSASTKDAVDEQYALFLNQFVADNPGVKPLVDRAIRPDLETAMTNLASQGQVMSF